MAQAHDLPWSVTGCWANQHLEAQPLARTKTAVYLAARENMGGPA